MYEKFNNIRLDLFKLHDSKDNTKNWIFAKGTNLKIELGILIEKTGFSHTELVKHLMKKLNTARVGLKHHGNLPSKSSIGEFRIITNTFFRRALRMFLR